MTDKPWIVEVQYTPMGDGRRRVWIPSAPMSYTSAKRKILEMEAIGIPARMIERHAASST